MASDSLVRVIGDLIRRENRMAKEEKAKIKAAEAEAAEAEEDEEDDEDEDPVGEPEAEPKAEPEPEEEEEPEDDGAGDTKPSGPDPTLVAQVAAIVKKEIADEAEEKKEDEVKLSGKKEKINTKPKLEQQEIRKGKMNFREAIRLSVTGTALTEGYEEVVLGILEDAKIDGPLGYEPFFEKGKLFVEKGSEKQATKVLKQSKDINKVPKIVGEELDPEEYLAMEAVEVDGRYKGFREALKRLTYAKLEKMKDEAQKEELEMPEGLSKEGAAEFMAAASAAKKEGKKKFKFGGKEYPVTIKVDIPLKGEQKEEVDIDESNELQAIMALDDAGIKAEINMKGQVVIKKKDKKKAHIALEKSFKKGGWPALKLEDVELTEGLGKLDKAVIDAFYYKKEKEGKVVSTDGDSLWKNGLGGQEMAIWNGRKIKITGATDSKSTESILKYMKKSIPSGLLEGVQHQRSAYEIVSKARKKAATNKPKWEPEDSEPRLS